MICKLVFLFCVFFFHVQDKRGKLSKSCSVSQTTQFVLIREDEVWVSLGQFYILNNTMCCPQSIHHCPDQLLRGCRCCPLSLSVDPAQLAPSASPSPFLWQTGLISRMINMAPILHGHSLSGFAFLNTHMESLLGHWRL